MTEETKPEQPSVKLPYVPSQKEIDTYYYNDHLIRCIVVDGAEWYVYNDLMKATGQHISFKSCIRNYADAACQKMMLKNTRNSCRIHWVINKRMALIYARRFNEEFHEWFIDTILHKYYPTEFKKQNKEETYMEKNFLLILNLVLLVLLLSLLMQQHVVQSWGSAPRTKSCNHCYNASLFELAD